MFALMAVRYLLKVDVPAVAFLLVAMLPIWWGNTSEQLAFAASCIPFSVAFQYKYALLILSVAILVKNRWRIKMSGAFIVVMAMMVWELWHAFYGQFSFVEYLRDFAELILLAIVTSIDMRNVDHKLVIRSLVLSVVGVCVIMLIMEMQQTLNEVKLKLNGMKERLSVEFEIDLDRLMAQDHPYSSLWDPADPAGQ